MRQIPLVYRILMVAAVIFLPGCGPPDLSSIFATEPSPTPDTSRQMAEHTLDLHEYWRATQISYGGGDTTEANLVAVAGRVLYLNLNYGENTVQAYVLDASSGTLLWKTPDDLFYNPAIDAERVYLYLQGRGMSGDSIQAYDLDDGRLLWEIPAQPHRYYNLYSEGDILCVHNLDDEEIWYLDARTGTELRRVTLDIGEGSRLLASFPQFDVYTFAYTRPDALLAVDETTRRPLWETEIEHVNATFTRPVLYQGRLLIIGDWCTITAVDVQTGEVKWDTGDDPLASNFVVANDSLYGIDFEARLVQRDIETGKETGYIQFTPERVDTSTNRYRVAVDGEMVFVFFSDSQELIALGP